MGVNMTLIDLDENRRTWLLNYLVKKADSCRYILDPKRGYSERAKQRAGDILANIEPIIKALKSPVIKAVKPSALEPRIAALETIVKKLVAYHRGEV